MVFGMQLCNTFLNPEDIKLILTLFPIVVLIVFTNNHRRIIWSTHVDKQAVTQLSTSSMSISTVNIKLMLHIDIKKMSPKIVFQPNLFSQFFGDSGHFLDTFLTSYWPHVLMSILYLQSDFRTMSKSSLLMLCRDLDQTLTSIWGSSAHWDHLTHMILVWTSHYPVLLYLYCVYIHCTSICISNIWVIHQWSRVQV